MPTVKKEGRSSFKSDWLKVKNLTQYMILTTEHFANHTKDGLPQDDRLLAHLLSPCPFHNLHRRKSLVFGSVKKSYQ